MGENRKIIGVRWHGRAGQGTVTAAKMVAEILINKGRYVQAFPEFGPERRGAPVRAFNRISDEPIYIYGPVEDPDYVLVADPFLVKSQRVKEGARENAVFILNTEHTPEEIREFLSLPESVKVFTVPATKIATEAIGRDLPNMPMLAAFFSVWGDISPEELKEAVREILSKYFAEDIVEKNIIAVEKTQEVFHG